MTLASLRDAHAVDMRPMSLTLKHALIAMDIEHELLCQGGETVAAAAYQRSRNNGGAGDGAVTLRPSVARAGSSPAPDTLLHHPVEPTTSPNPQAPSDGVGRLREEVPASCFSHAAPLRAGELSGGGV